MTCERISAIKTAEFASILLAGNPPYAHRTWYDGGFGDAYAPTANRYTCSPVIAPIDVVLKKIGVWIGTQVNSGNIKFAVHKANNNFVPVTKIAETASVAFGAITTNEWKFVAPTSERILKAGLYYVGFVCDTTFNAGVAGIRIGYPSNIHPNNNKTVVADIHALQYHEDVGSFNIPNPMTASETTARQILPVGLAVNPIYGAE